MWFKLHNHVYTWFCINFAPFLVKLLESSKPKIKDIPEHHIESLKDNHFTLCQTRFDCPLLEHNKWLKWDQRSPLTLQSTQHWFLLSDAPPWPKKSNYWLTANQKCWQGTLEVRGKLRRMINPLFNSAITGCDALDSVLPRLQCFHVLANTTL